MIGQESGTRQEAIKTARWTARAGACLAARPVCHCMRQPEQVVTTISGPVARADSQAVAKIWSARSG